MAKKKLLHFLLYDYQGYTAKTDFLKCCMRFSLG